MSEKIDLFDLDEIVEEQRFVKIKGVDHEVKEASVGDYLALLKEEKTADGNEKESTPEESIERMVQVVSRSIPSCPREDIEGLTSKKLMALIRWLNQANEPEHEEGEELEK